MSPMGQTRKWPGMSRMSAPPSIVLQKSFWVDQRKFLGPLMHFALGDVRGHIISRKNDHGPAYRRYGPLQRQILIKIDFREILGIVRFSSFATQSPQQQTFIMATVTSAKCHKRTHALQQKGYSITSSARARRDAGTSIPSDLAVLRLMMSSYLEGCSMGRSAGLAPLRMRST